MTDDESTAVWVAGIMGPLSSAARALARAEAVRKSGRSAEIVREKDRWLVQEVAADALEEGP